MKLEDGRVLVTGGAGFIGSHVAKALVRRGATVAVVDNLSVGRRDFVPGEATLHEIDIRDDAFHDILDTVEPTAIVHLAALHYIPYCIDHPTEAFEVNVMGTRNVLECARALDALRVVINASTAAVYPPDDGQLSEDMPVGPMDIYGATKLIGEDLARLFHADTGTPTTSARLFNVYGSHETNPHLIPAILEQLHNGAREVELGNLTPRRDFIHVSDVARAITTMLTDVDNSYRTFNVGTGVAHSVRDVATTVGDALGTELCVTQAEDRVRDSDRPHLCADISRIKTELDWEPESDLEAGLSQLLTVEGLDENA